METEIELKFFVSPTFLAQIELMLKDVKVLQQGKRYLHNTYFDSKDFVLRQNDIGLRIRRFDDVYVQTLKTSGRVVAGLHQRPEYNAELNSPILDLSLVPEQAWPDTFSINQLELLPIFSTDFTRHQWLIAMPDSSQIELAFDSGKVNASDKQDTICEVEIELKSGQVDALFLFARKLAEKGALRLGNLSKAARGYRLATDQQSDAIKALSLVPVKKTHSIEQGFIKSMEHALAHWHHHEQIFIEQQNIHALVEITQAIKLIRQTFRLYSELIPKRASALLRQELAWLEGEFSWIEEVLALEHLCEDKGNYLRKLNVQKQLVVKFEQRAEHITQTEQMLNLFQSSRYCHLLLDLSRWLLTRGWQPFLDEKAQSLFTQSLFEVAATMLEDSWQAILCDETFTQAVDSSHYLDKKILLSQSLLSSYALAALYEEEGIEAFHLPWLDLSQGIQDLFLLEPIRAALLDNELSDEHKVQMKKWLERKASSLLHAMLQTKQMGLDIDRFWL